MSPPVAVRSTEVESPMCATYRQDVRSPPRRTPAAGLGRAAAAAWGAGVVLAGVVCAGVVRAGAACGAGAAGFVAGAAGFGGVASAARPLTQAGPRRATARAVWWEAPRPAAAAPAPEPAKTPAAVTPTSARTMTTVALAAAAHRPLAQRECRILPSRKRMKENLIRCVIDLRAARRIRHLRQDGHGRPGGRCGHASAISGAVVRGAPQSGRDSVTALTGSTGTL